MNFIKRAVQQVAATAETQRQMSGKGIFLPSDLMAGRHFGGFHGYDKWIQDCIRACCRVSHDVPPEELAELTGFALFQADDQEPIFVVQKHSDVMRMLDEYVERSMEELKASEHETVENVEKCREHVRRAEGTRVAGTLMVVALRWVNRPADTITIKDETGLGVKEVQILGAGLMKELRVSVSCWNPASVEEAKEVPKQGYLLG